jgi:hypothetical protein
MSICNYIIFSAMVNLPDEYNSFVDRDMFMRHLGGGIGHQTAQQNNMHAEEMDMDIDIDEVEEGSVHDEGNYSGQPDRGTSGKFDEEDGKDEEEGDDEDDEDADDDDDDDDDEDSEEEDLGLEDGESGPGDYGEDHEQNYDDL